MQVIKATIQPLEDIGKVGPEIKNPDKVVPLEVADVCFMEDGTVGKKMSVFFVLHDSDGKEYKAEITEGNFDMLVGIFKGAQFRFNHLKQNRARKN